MTTLTTLPGEVRERLARVVLIRGVDFLEKTVKIPGQTILHVLNNNAIDEMQVKVLVNWTREFVE